MSACLFWISPGWVLVQGILLIQSIVVPPIENNLQGTLAIAPTATPSTGAGRNLPTLGQNWSNLTPSVLTRSVFVNASNPGFISRLSKRIWCLKAGLIRAVFQQRECQTHRFQTHLRPKPHSPCIALNSREGPWWPADAHISADVPHPAF